MKRILVVNVNWLGDVIFSSPVFRALRCKYPEAHIACMAVPRVRGILECIDEIDEIIEYDEEGKHKGIFQKIKLVGQLKENNFDSVFLLSRSFSRASMMAMARIPVRVGYENKGRGKLLTHISKPPEDNCHRSDYYLGVIQSYGIPAADYPTTLNVKCNKRNEVREIFTRNNVDDQLYKIAVNPGGNWDLKRWPKDHFTNLINLLNERMKCQMILIGAQKDAELVHEILKGVNPARKPAVLTGQLTLKQLVAFMIEIDLLISADSGPLHMASSVGCQAIGIFGPTRPEITGPRGLNKEIVLQKDVGCNRQACYFLRCPDNICMQAISAEDVYEIVKSLQNS